MEICCNQVFCIYWQDDRCALNTITINTSGFCRNFVEVDLGDSPLEKLQELSNKLYKRMEFELSLELPKIFCEVLDGTSPRDRKRGRHKSHIMRKNK